MTVAQQKRNKLEVLMLCMIVQNVVETGEEVNIKIRLSDYIMK